MLMMGHKIIAISIVVLFITIISGILNYLYCYKKIGFRFEKTKIESNLIKEIMFFSLYVFINIIVDVLYSSTDSMILGVLKGTSAVTVYSFGIYFSTYFQQLSTAISGVFMPQLSYLYETKDFKTEMSNMFVKVGRIQSYIILLVLSGYVLFGMDFIKLWIGSEYNQAYVIGLIIMIPSLIPLTQNIGISVLRVMNLHKYRSYMYLTIAIINVLISIPLSIKFSGVGAAIGTMISTIIGQIIFMNIFYYKIGVNIKLYWKNIIQSLTVTCVVMICSRCILAKIFIDNWCDLIIAIAIYVIVFLGAFYILILNCYEKDLIRKIIPIRK